MTYYIRYSTGYLFPYRSFDLFLAALERAQNLEERGGNLFRDEVRGYYVVRD